jgi:hypothetical protein
LDEQAIQLISGIILSFLSRWFVQNILNRQFLRLQRVRCGRTGKKTETGKGRAEWIAVVLPSSVLFPVDIFRLQGV